MALLIDGYNLLHVTDIFGPAGAGTELHRTRLALLDALAVAIDQRERRQTTIVFDAAGAPPGLPSITAHDGMTVRFARKKASADELIEELIEECAAPKALTVVSSDHRVQRAARRCGAIYVDSDRWYNDLQAVKRERESAASDSAAKPQGGVSSEETDFWLKEFTKQPEKKRRR
jgi:predicted RNA-binding protein with PIN domain